MTSTDFLQLLIYGVVHGSILSLGAIGVSLVFGLLRFSNFAHGDLMTLGAYLAFAAVTVSGMPVLAALPFAIAGTVLAAVTIDQGIFRRFRHASPVILLIASYGVAVILRSLIQLIWGTKDRVYEEGIQMPLRFGDLVIRPDHLIIIGGTVLLVVALELFLKFTPMGKAMRAMADNMDLARVTGVNSERVVIWVWVLGASLAAAAGVFLAIDTRLHPVAGWHILLPIFAAVILGGIGRIDGAILGGLLVGIAEEMSTAFISPAYKTAVAFAILVIMLIVRPSGLLKGRL